MNNKIVVILLLLITAGIAFAAEDWNLGTVQTFWNVDIKGGNISANGSGLTNINVSNATGTLANERLPANITGKTNITSKQIGGVIYADQYATIQTAINENCPNCEIIIKSGTYLTTNISLPSNTTIRCLGNATIKNTDTTKELIRNADWTHGNSNINIYGCIFDGMNGSTTHVAGFGGIDNSQISGNTFMNSSSIVVGIGRLVQGAVFFNNSLSNDYDVYNVDFSNNIIKDGWNRDNDMFGSGFTTNLQIHNNWFENGGVCTNTLASWKGKIYNNYYTNCYQGIRNEASREMTISGNTIVNSTNKGIHVVSDLTGLGAGYEHVGSESVLISENIINGVIDEFGIFVQNSKGAIIVSNNINNTGQLGIYVHSTKDVIVSHNIITDWGKKSAARAIDVDTVIGDFTLERAIISNNIFRNNSISVASTGIRLLDSGAQVSARFDVSGNSFGNVTTNISYGYGQTNIDMYNFGRLSSAPPAFGAGDTYYNSTSNIQQLYTGSAWDWFLMPSKVYGTGVTNNNNGSVTISSILSQCPTSLVNGSMCLNYTTGAQNNYFDGSWRYTNGTIIT